MNMMKQFRSSVSVLSTCAALVCASVATAQQHIDGKVDIPFNRYVDHNQLNEYLKQIAAAYPDLVTLKTIGHSQQGREMIVAIVNNPKSGADTEKPAMWIDGNVHGNEIQAAEVVVYSLWYMTKAYGVSKDMTELVDNYSFYYLPSQNPDGRQAWFDEVQTSSSSRWSRRPVDNDRDGLVDEDPPEDIDGDGSITQMWKKDPSGDWLRDEFDPRVFRRARLAEGEKGEWIRLGSEGIDTDGDGRINEDGPGGDDMNRSWPTAWQPEYVQNAATIFPLADPETRAVAEFILAHPNIAAGQSYHNAGGMILRGPGASWRNSEYPAQDRRVYDEIGRVGEILLPYYNYYIIYDDLYTVHGGFVNWLAEGLGIMSFTNEMMTNGRFFQREGQMDEERSKLWRDRMAFGTTFKEYEEFDHPEYGKVLIGGPNRWSSRATPNFMLEEECHRNFAFTMFHASHMPLLSFDRVEAKDMGGGLWQVTVEIRNEKLIPSRLAVARMRGIGTNDILTCEPSNGSVVTSGSIGRWIDTDFNAVRDEPGRIQLPGGIGGQSSEIYRFIVTGKKGDTVALKYTAEKAKNIETTVELK
ncbi:MAG: peptidase M14 [Phycisphaeraceae bacterium]|nr:hypothetical protein [Phycisphaerales bacterium]MCB9860654.1 peptidase M14 [Phycisphaeraceae bacterium]